MKKVSSLVLIVGYVLSITGYASSIKKTEISQAKQHENHLLSLNRIPASEALVKSEAKSTNDCKPLSSKLVQKPYRDYSITKHSDSTPFGPATSDRIRKSKKFGISYHTKGMAYQNACVQKMRLNAIEAYILEKQQLGVSEHVLADFRNQATELVSNPNAIGDVVDSCFTQTFQRWYQCGGAYEKTAKLMNRNREKLQVQIMEAPFFVRNSTGGNIWAAGMASIDKRSLFAMVSTISSTYSNNYYVRSMESLVCWELGNTFGLNHGAQPRTLTQEIGFQVPCTFYKKNK